MKTYLERSTLLLIIFLTSYSLAEDHAPTDERAAVLTALHNQQEAWNAGDLNKFMQGYWKSDSLVFVGRNGPKFGFNTTRLNYQKSYPNKEMMGILNFTVLYLKQWDAKTIQIIGKYALKRVNDHPAGFFTLLYRKINGEWKIVSDHSSAESE